MVSLDGSTSYIGNEFIKLEITGSSHLATQHYVNTAVANSGGGGAVDAYTKTETDNLLNTKLNVNNPQDIEGTLRLGSVGGTSKIIVNALSSTKDFYVNGDAQVLGNHLVASLDSTSYIKGTNIITNTINADNLNDIYFQSNGVSYLQLDVSENKLISSKLIQCGGNLTTQEIDTIANLDLVIKRNNIDYITLADGQINFNQPTNISVDTTNLVKKTGETDQKIDGTVSINGDTITGYELTVAGQVHTQGMYVASDTDLIFGNPTQYITNPFGTAHIRHYANGEHQFYCNGVEDFLIDQNKALARGNMLCVGQFQGSIFNSFNNNTVDVSFRKANVELMKLGGAKVMAYFPLGVASNIYDSVDNTDVVFKRNFVDFFFLRNNSVELSSGISLSTSSAKIDTIDTVGDNDLAFKRNNDSFMSFSQATGKIFLQKDTEIQGDVNFIANKTIKIDNLDTVGDNDMVIKRNNIEFLRLDGPRTVVNGPENYIIIGNNVGLNTDWIFANTFANRSDNTDTNFRGAISGGLASGTIYMTYEHVAQNLHVKTDMELDQDKKLYIHKETSKNSFISSINIAGVNHTTFQNEDPNGDLRFSANGNVILFITPTKVSVPVPYTLEGDLVDTSDKTKKYDIKSIEHNFTDIVKQIEPKTFKMNDEKEIGITKNHLGFIANEIEEVIPDEWENIVVTDDEGIKKLSYVKMTAILWGVCREQQNKIEHLESSVYELQEALKDLIKPKPKPKSKSKKSNID